jgi:hypothetical protein
LGRTWIYATYRGNTAARATAAGAAVSLFLFEFLFISIRAIGLTWCLLTGNRLRRFGKYGECPSVSMSGCWRDSALERQLWRDADVLNGGEDSDVGDSSGHQESRGRLNTHSKSGSGHHDSSLHGRKQRRGSSGVKSGRKGAEGAVAAHERRRRKAVEKGESSTPSSSWFW